MSFERRTGVGGEKSAPRVRAGLVMAFVLGVAGGACSSKGSTGVGGAAGATGFAGAGVAGSIGLGVAGSVGTSAAGGTTGAGGGGNAAAGAAGTTGTGAGGSTGTSVAGATGTGMGGATGSGAGGAGGVTVDAGVGVDGSPDVASDAVADAGVDGTASASIVPAVLAASQAPIDVLLLVDRSGSMNEDLSGMSCGNGCGATSKWSILSNWLTTFLPTTEATVNWGLKLFASGSNNTCSVAQGADVAPTPMNAAAIVTRIAATVAGSSTPTTTAVAAASDYLSTVVDGAPHFILLATDGIPTCGTSPCPPGLAGNPNQCDDAAAIAAVQSAHDRGIPTFVVGIGTTSSPGSETLSEMAYTGGYPRAGTPAYYPIDAADDLTSAFGAITTAARTCLFQLTTAIDPATTRIVGVQADGAPLAPAAYVIFGTNQIQLGTQACADYGAGKIKAIAAVTIRNP